MFYPPKPDLISSRTPRIMRFFKNLRSSISVFTEQSYQMKMGEVRGLKERTYFLAQPDLVRKLLTSSIKTHPKSNLIEKTFSVLLGQGLFMSSGDTWIRRRKMVEGAFGTANISKVFPHMLAAAEDLCSQITEGKVQIDRLTNQVSVDIIFRTLFSKAIEPDETNHFFEVVDSFLKSAHGHASWCVIGLPERLSPFRRKTERTSLDLREVLARRVDERLSVRGAEQSPEDDLLDALINSRDDDGVGFTRDELVDEVAVLFLAGHETSAGVMAWAFYLIANSPDIQGRLHQEIDTVVGKGVLEQGHFRKLPLVRNVFRETLRLFPPVAFVPRKTTVTETWRDKVIKPGSTIFVAVWLLQRNPQIWEDPDGFDPDRFSTPQGKQSSREGYVPFSMGPRVCIGASFAIQEAAIVMSVLLQKFHFSPTDHLPRPVSKLTVRSENGIELNVTRRAPYS